MDDEKIVDFPARLPNTRKAASAALVSLVRVSSESQLNTYGSNGLLSCFERCLDINLCI